MRRQLKRLGWVCEFGLLYGLFSLARIIPLSLLLALGRSLGRFAFTVLRVRRAVVLDNLRHAFGSELNDAELRDLAGRFYVHLGQTLMEFFHLHGTGRDDLFDQVEIEGEHHLSKLRKDGRGAILVSGHFGNWELFASVLVHRGYPVNYVIKNQSNPWVDRMQNQIRTRTGMGLIRMQHAGRGIVQSLRAKEFIGILGDQNAGNQGLFLSFLGRQASVFRGPAYFAWRCGCPLVPCAIVRTGPGRHRVILTEPIYPDQDLDEETAVRQLSQAHVDMLASFIRQWPEQYFWVHRRWKTRPPKEMNRDSSH